MAASTVSVSPDPTMTTRRRPVDKGSAAGGDILNNNHDPLLTAIPVQNTTAQSYAPLTEGDGANKLPRDRDAVMKKGLSNATGATNRRATASSRNVSKSKKPTRLTSVKVLIKYLLLLLVVVGLIQMVRQYVVMNAAVTMITMTSNGIHVISDDWEGKFTEMDSFVKKSTKLLQVQLDVIDRKLDKHMENVKGEMETRDVRIDKKLSNIRENLERELGEKSKRLLSKDEFEGFLEEYMKGKGKQARNDDGLSLDEVRDYARQIVEREIEKHAADGLGRVDYAVASGGAMVVKHSEPLDFRRVGRAWNWVWTRNDVHPNAQKMLTSSFGEPGKCFCLKGSSGFVIIRLRTAIVPEAVTLEHVAKSVAYDRSSAPKDCRVFGWLQVNHLADDMEAESEEMFLLTEFTYDLDKSNAQTFNVLDSVGSSLIDTIMFDSTSNHGSLFHTCIYRLRIHGHEPSSLSMLVASEP